MNHFLKSNRLSLTLSAAVAAILLSPLFWISEAKYFFIFSESVYFPLTTCLFFTIYFFANRFKSIITEITIIDAFIFLFYFYSVVNTGISNNSGFNSSISMILSPLLLYLPLKHYFLLKKENPSTIQYFFIHSIFMIGLVPILIGTLEYVGIFPIPVRFKITGGFLNPGVFANVIASIYPFFIGIITLNGNVRRSVKLTSAFMILAATAVLFISNARSAWVGSCISTAYVLWHSERLSEWKKSLFSNYTRIIIVSSVILIAIVTTSYMLYNLKKDSTYGRLFIWKLCIDIIKENPVFGIGNGYNSFPKVFNEQQRLYFEQNPNDTQNGLLAGDAKYAFNDYLQILVEEGIVGFTLFLCIVFLVLVRRNPRKKKNSVEERFMLIVSKSCIIAILVCSLFSYPLKIASNYALFLVFIAYISSNFYPLNYHSSFVKKTYRTISALIFLSVLLILYYQIFLLHNCYKWKEAFISFRTGNIKNSIDQYQKIHTFFDSYFLFMFNYGSILYVTGNVNEAITIFESSLQLNGTYDTYLNLGGCYEMTSRFDKAEECYIRSSNSIPHKLSPKYKLFKLYNRTNQSVKAIQVASIIKDMNIKIYTPEAEQIKIEIYEFLKKN